MTLTVVSDLTILTTAESYASPPWYAIGAQTPATEPDFFVQGSNCLSRAVSGSVTKGMWYDNTSGIDFDTAAANKDKLVYIWMISNTPGLCATRAAGGLRVILGTTTTDYREWYVDGSDTISATDRWVCYVIDPQSAGSVADTGTYDPTSVRYFGGTMTTTTTAKGQNFGIDQIAYGRGELRVSGTVATSGSGFKEIAAVAYDTAKTNRWGILTEKQGIYYIKGKIVIGNGITRGSNAWTVAVATNVVTVQTIVSHNMTTNSVFSTNGSWTNNAFMANLSGKTVASIPTTTSFTFALTQGNQGATTETNTAANIGANTTFSSYNETVIWETPDYYIVSGTQKVKTIPDASVGSTTGSDGLTTYNGISFNGGSGTTTIDFGIIAGTDSGRSGSSFNCVSNPDLSTPGRTKAWVSGSDASMALSLYASTFIGFEGGIYLYGTNLSGDDCFANTFGACGQTDSNMEIRNTNFLNTTITTGAFLWRDSVSDIQKSSFINNSRGIQHTASAGSPYTYTDLLFSSNTYDVNNTSGVTIDISKSGTSNPSTYDTGGSTVTFTGSVPVKITVKNALGTAIQDAQCAIYKTSDSSQIMNKDSLATGIASDSYTGTTPADCYWRVRKSSTGTTKYISQSGNGTIDSGTGFSVSVTLVEDTNA